MIVVFLIILTIQCKAFNLIRLCGYLDGSQTDYSSVALPRGTVDCSAVCDCACEDPEGGQGVRTPPLKNHKRVILDCIDS